jgi:hypothetical protein
MDKYYYLAAQIPLLSPDMDTPPTVEWFLDEAKKWLSPSDYRAVSKVDINDYQNKPSKASAASRYTEFERKLRSELASFRKARKDDYEYRLQGFSTALVKEGNPLEVEKKLVRTRWAYLDELEFGHYSDVDFLVITALKLQLLERLASFDKEKGMKEFENVVANIINPEETENREETEKNKE